MYKQIIVIRSGLKMSKGKIAAQAAHASVSAAGKAGKKILIVWEKQGQKKVVLKADMKQLTQLREKCKKLRIPCVLIRDAGLTEIRTGTVTAIGIGPEKEEKINKITGSLPLL